MAIRPEMKGTVLSAGDTSQAIFDEGGFIWPNALPKFFNVEVKWYI